MSDRWQMVDEWEGKQKLVNEWFFSDRMIPSRRTTKVYSSRQFSPSETQHNRRRFYALPTFDDLVVDDPLWTQISNSDQHQCVCVCWWFTDVRYYEHIIGSTSSREPPRWFRRGITLASDSADRWSCAFLASFVYIEQHHHLMSKWRGNLPDPSSTSSVTDRWSIPMREIPAFFDRHASNECAVPFSSSTIPIAPNEARLRRRQTNVNLWKWIIFGTQSVSVIYSGWNTEWINGSREFNVDSVRYWRCRIVDRLDLIQSYSL